METGELRTDAELQRAIRNFQRIANIRQTGRLDAETVMAMKRPRCGMADLLDVGRWTPNDYVDGMSGAANADGSRHRHGHGEDWTRQGRPQEYTFGPSKWEKTQLTFRILNFTPDLSYPATRDAIVRALNVWSDVTQLTFHEVQSGPADILIEFASGYHHDGYPFDGPGSVLAHAFFPGDERGGDVHFDEDETWTVHSESGVDLFMVAAHELGHALGLAHSTVPGSLMYPWHQGHRPGFTLPYDDTVAIQLLYGGSSKPRSQSTVRPTPRQPPPSVTTRPRKPYLSHPSVTSSRLPPTTRSTVPPSTTAINRRAPVTTRPPHFESNRPLNECTANFDAISLIRGEVFAFKGKWFWRITSDGVMEGHPVEISRFWYGLPPEVSHIDAVFERTGDGHIVFFSGDKFWDFSGTERYAVAGQPLTDLGLPSDIDRVDAAFVWGHNRRTYLISGNMYWKLQDSGRKVETHTYPRDMSMWAGVPLPVDSAFTHTDGRTYFFHGPNFFEFNNARMHIQHGQPRSVSQRWLNCTTASSDRDTTVLTGLTGGVQSVFTGQLPITTVVIFFIIASV
jgi:hypothetical protein